MRNDNIRNAIEYIPDLVLILRTENNVFLAGYTKEAF